MRPLVVIGPIAPVLRLALVRNWTPGLRIRETSLQGPRLIKLSRRLGAKAVVAPRQRFTELCGEVPRGLLLVGVSIASWDVLCCDGSKLSHLPNPSPEGIGRFILEWEKQDNAEG